MPSSLGWLARAFSSGVLISCPVACAQANVRKIPVKTVTKSAPPAPTPKVTQEAPKVVEPKKVEAKKEEPEKKPAPNVQEVMKKVMEENNYSGCGLLQGFRDRRTTWYVCSGGQAKSNKPTFYNYDKNKPEGSRNRQLVSLSSSSKKATFTEGLTETIALPFWMNKFGGKDLEPENNCKFEPKGGSKTSFSLKCHEQLYPYNIDF